MKFIISIIFCFISFIGFAQISTEVHGISVGKTSMAEAEHMLIGKTMTYDRKFNILMCKDTVIHDNMVYDYMLIKVYKGLIKSIFLIKSSEHKLDDFTYIHNKYINAYCDNLITSDFYKTSVFVDMQTTLSVSTQSNCIIVAIESNELNHSDMFKLIQKF